MRLTHVVAALATLTAGACSTGKQEASPSATATDAPSHGPSAALSTALSATATHGPWVRLATGETVVCAADAGGALVCWGRTPEPTHVRGLIAPKGAALAVSDEAVCVGLSRGAVRCVHLDSSKSFATELTAVRAIRMVYNGVCALDDAGVECAFGRLYAPDPPVRVEGIAAPTSFDAQSSILCAIDAGGLTCASLFVPRPPYGVDEAAKPPILAKPIRGTQGAVDVAVGGGIVCARTEAGTVLCRTDKVAKVVAGLPKATQIVVGTGHAFVIDGAHACVLDEVGAVRCWGNNNDGQLGAPSGRCPEVDKHAPKTGPDHRCDEPLLVDGLPPVAELAAGNGFTCALTTLGDVYCWGEGNGPPDGSAPHLMKL